MFSYFVTANVLRDYQSSKIISKKKNLKQLLISLIDGANDSFNKKFLLKN